MTLLYPMLLRNIGLQIGLQYAWKQFGSVGEIFFLSLGPHPGPMEVPRLGVESELQLPAYATATATATSDQNLVCNLHHSSWQCQILNPLSETRDRTCHLWLLVGFVNH